ncbi:MAG TPA: hypothetical protein EYH03_02580 [Chromatiales bacterium]|nr:hypothetical protein [Chromatiales bacterium]
MSSVLTTTSASPPKTNHKSLSIYTIVSLAILASGNAHAGQWPKGLCHRRIGRLEYKLKPRPHAQHESTAQRRRDRVQKHPMHISSKLNAAQLILGAHQGGLTRTLRVGQRLAAVVLESKPLEMLKLRIGTTVVSAQSHLRFSPGSKLQLEVVRTGRQPELKLIVPESPTQLRAEALKTSLPNQVPLPQVLQWIATTLAASPSMLMTLPPALRDALRSLLDTTAKDGAPVTSSALRQRIQNSGLFLEAALLSSTAPHQDLKAQLLRLYRLIQDSSFKTSSNDGQAVPETTRRPPLLDALERNIQGAIARIQIDQLSALDQEGNSIDQWRIDLPLRNGDQYESLRLHIRKETPTGTDTKEPQAIWSIALDFDLEPTGRFQVHIHLTGDEIATHFRTEHPQTNDLIGGQLPRLRKAFEKAGMNVRHLDSSVGLHPAPPPWEGVERLLDETV